MEKQALSSQLVWAQKVVALGEGKLAASINCENALPFELTVPTSGDLFQGVLPGEEMMNDKDLFCSIICNAKNLEITQAFTNEGLAN